MDLSRRDIIKLGSAAIGSLILPSVGRAQQDVVSQYGWVDIPAARQWYTSRIPKPYLAQYSTIKGSGKNAQVCLWQAYEKIAGTPYAPHAQERGTCVGEGFTLGAEVLSTCEIARGDREEWRGKFSTEVTYAGSRVEIGKGAIRTGDGSTGAWAAEWLRQYGVVLRDRYGEYDLSRPSPQLAVAWGKPRAGVPDDIENLAKEHPVKTTAMVTTWDEYCDAIANGYPVAICSNVGFNDRRDQDGFLRRSGVWYHCMLGWGVDSKSTRQGGCIANSWGTNWVSGPEHKLGTPPGCFWADANVIHAMLQQGDSYALSGFKGFPSQDLDFLLI